MDPLPAEDGNNNLSDSEMSSISSRFILLMIILAALLSSLYSYVLFHTMIELFTVVITGLIFVIVWNLKDRIDNNFLLVIGVACFFIGAFDFLHTISYSGIDAFDTGSSNLATQLWIISRYIEAFTFLSAILLLNKRTNPYRLFLLYLFLSAGLLLTISPLGIFPDCYIEGEGLTLFKIISEYIICAVLFAALLLLYKNKDYFDPDIHVLISVSIIFTILAEISFTTYLSVYGFSNLIGHIFRIIAFIFLYKAFVESALRRPFTTIYHQLKESEHQFKIKFISLFDNMADGVAFFKVIFDEEGCPYDFCMLEVNRHYETVRGIPREKVLNKCSSDLDSEIIREHFDEIMGVIRTGNPARFESYSSDSGRYYVCSVFSYDIGYFGIIYSDITERKLSENMLRNSLEEKTALLQEVHHRVKNNLQVIISLLDLNRHESGNEMINEVLNETQSRIIAMSLVHEAIYLSDKVSTIDADSHLRTLGLEVLAYYAADCDIILDVEADGCFFDLKTAIPVSLVFNELITNSVKYAFKGRKNGKITFRGECKDGYANMIYCDDGIGISGDIDLINSRSLGITIITSIVRSQLDGTIELVKNEGVCWKIRFPLKKRYGA
ncbi:signal transduction histidine kinase [Methanoplanus limicola DSM 2279]|uniref:histidine kinase n=2 Tax=Methanoplanus limicola TaxID=2315 RepID=H1YYT7_9EURY|nr:signal transduction histidine kinase [Methanoplanus limicola DSM 2279]